MEFGQKIFPWNWFIWFHDVFLVWTFLIFWPSCVLVWSIVYMAVDICSASILYWRSPEPWLPSTPIYSTTAAGDVRHCFQIRRKELLNCCVKSCPTTYFERTKKLVYYIIIITYIIFDIKKVPFLIKVCPLVRHHK